MQQYDNLHDGIELYNSRYKSLVGSVVARKQK